ncbi:hypothetical protein Bca4012_031143 [Brassica carinata]
MKENDVLIIILSFLTTKEVALTHVLSKIWSNLLQLVLILDFDESLLLNRKMGREPTKITGYEGTGEELSHMDLGTLTLLEMVRVTHKGVDDTEMPHLVNDLLILPKTSPKCKVQVMKESA